jgi:hypothetical protein
MPRAEANLVLPAVTAFGAVAEKWLIDGLRAKKSFLRQGCALGLGVVKSPLAGEALVRLLISEPTEIWTEVARAIGDLGAPAAELLYTRLRDIEPSLRERIVLALAHLCARGVDLGKGDGPLATAAIARALELAPEVDAEGAQSRASDFGENSTVIRNFSRRFYDTLNGALDISLSDLEELESGEIDTEEEASEGATRVTPATQVRAEADRVAAHGDGRGGDATARVPRMSLPKTR